MRELSGCQQILIIVSYIFTIWSFALHEILGHINIWEIRLSLRTIQRIGLSLRTTQRTVLSLRTTQRTVTPADVCVYVCPVARTLNHSSQDANRVCVLSNGIAMSCNKLGVRGASEQWPEQTKKQKKTKKQKGGWCGARHESTISFVNKSRLTGRHDVAISEQRNVAFHHRAGSWSIDRFHSNVYSHMQCATHLLQHLRG